MDEDLDRDLNPTLQNIINNAGNQYGNSSYFHQAAERPRNSLMERGFSLSSQHNEYPNYEQLQPRPLMNEIPSSLDEFDRNLLGFDAASRQHPAGLDRARLSIPPRNLNNPSSQNPSNHALGMQGLHSRPPRQPVVPPPPPSYTPLLRGREPTGIFHGATQLNQLQPARQQATPTFNLGGFAYAPATRQSVPAQSSSPRETSSPSAQIMQRRILQQGLGSSQKMAPVAHMGGDHYHEEINKSQPIRPPATPERQATISAPKNHVPQVLALGHAPPVIQGIQLISSRELPDRFRQVFPYALFNAVQSKCFPYVFRTNDNVVVSAPTGSGKTAILELAICKLVEGFDVGQVKIIYLAPTKSLCAERVRDWENKFRCVNLPCALLTGDTESSEMKTVGSAVIIVTTPEKWDSITRKWKDHMRLLEMVKLVLIDEVHILKDTRGATLEAVVSRMKSIGASIRFIALSATVPNSQDIATWLGRDHTNDHLPAHRQTFGEEFRPVKLQKHIHGFDSNSNDFAFDSILDSKLPALVSKYTHKKPMMVFCFTRKSCEKTAQTLTEWWQKCRDNDRAWPAPNEKLVTSSIEVNKLLGSGVAFHHAGLDAQDRSVIENGFLGGQIHVICCTSTLAVGVNLPCHLVVIKNTVGYQDGGKLMEYSDLEVMQMLGRAGRPQFDDSAIAIIMTRSEKVDRYKKMISGQEILESTLHLNLIEHLNSEVGLGTINNVHSAKRWLSSTFLAVRMRQNPNYYKLDGVGDTRDVDRKLEQVCERDINLLHQTKLISNVGRLSSTEYGEAMSRYMVQFETMKLLLSIPQRAKMSLILHIVAQSSEFNDQFRMKPNERPAFRELNKSPLIKWPIKENITTTAHKVSIMIQAQLSGVELPNDKETSLNRMQYVSEKRLVFERIQRLLKCFIDCRAYDCDAVSTRNALELTRSIAAENWENSPMQLRQIQGIGPAAIRRFIASNINSIDKLRNTEPADIERYLSKNPPFGRRLLNNLADFPRLTLKAEFMRSKPRKPNDPVKMTVNAHIGLANSKASYWNHKQVTVTFMAEVSDGTLVNFWRGNLLMLQRNPDLKFDASISTPEDTITCSLACDEIVGTIREVVLQPNLPPSAFPPPKAKSLQRKISAGQKKASKVADSYDEFGSDDFDDSELIAVLDKVAPPSQSYNDDEFEDIDRFDSPSPKALDKATKRPGKMSNGKWKCNHDCADGAPTKSGGPCKHACCRDGLDKPRKPSAPRKKDPPDAAKSSDERSLDKSATKSNKNKGSEPRLRIASQADQDKQRNMPTEVINLADQPNVSEEYWKLQGLHESVQKGNSIKLPKATAAFSYASGATLELPFSQNRNQTSIGDFEDENEFGSEHSDDFDLPSPSQLFQEHLDVESPLPRPVFKLVTPHGSSHYEDDAGIESGTIGLQEPIEPSETPEMKTVPKLTQSFEDDCVDYGSFDENDYDYPIQAATTAAKAMADPESHVAFKDGSSGSSRKRNAPEMTDETTAVKFRRLTRDKEAVPQPSPSVVDPQTLMPVHNENQQDPEVADEDDGECVTFTYGGNTVVKRKRKGNSTTPLPDWVTRDMPPDFYEEYGDFVDFV